MRRISEIGPIAFVHQKEQLGLGHAVLMAKELVGDEPFAVLLSDDVMLNPGGKPVTEQLIEQYYAPPRLDDRRPARARATTSTATGSSAPLHQRGAPGRDRRPGREAGGRRGAVGPRRCWAATSSAPRSSTSSSTTQRGAGGEIQLTDAIRALTAEQPVFGYQFEGVRHDAGTRLGWLKANIAMSLESDLADELRAYVRSLDLRD